MLVRMTWAIVGTYFAYILIWYVWMWMVEFRDKTGDETEDPGAESDMPDPVSKEVQTSQSARTDGDI